MKKLFLTLSLLLFAVGLALLLCDWDTFRRYGVHSNETAGITEEGDVIPWPTGEAPWFAQISIRTYVLLFWLSSAGAYYLRNCVRDSYQGRIRRGTE